VIVYGEREWWAGHHHEPAPRARGLPPVVFGKGDQVRDFTYVGDAVSRHRPRSSPARPTIAFNVATGVGTDVATLRACARVTGVAGAPSSKIRQGTARARCLTACACRKNCRR
jgi:nucleoside-diphosphate-sugar epimerase